MEDPHPDSYDGHCWHDGGDVIFCCKCKAPWRPSAFPVCPARRPERRYRGRLKAETGHAVALKARGEETT